MTRKEFEEWLDSNNYRTVFNTEYIPFNYIGEITKTEMVYCADGSCGTYECVEFNSKWRVNSELKIVGDRPSQNYLFHSRESFETEEQALAWLKNKILEHYENCIIWKKDDGLLLYKDIVCNLRVIENKKYLVPILTYENFKKLLGVNDFYGILAMDEKLKNQNKQERNELKEKAISYGFTEHNYILKLKIYTSEDFKMTNVQEYGISYGKFELEENNEIIYACEILTGMSDVPHYIQLTKQEYDSYIEKIKGNENIELPKIDEESRTFLDGYRNSGRNHFSYNDVFHENKNIEEANISKDDFMGNWYN